MHSQAWKPKITEKYLPFKLSQVRFYPAYGPQVDPLVVTGSAQEEVNSLCVWQYNRRGDIEIAPLDEENFDMTLPTPHMDSADDPHLVCSTAHVGSVQQLKVHTPSQLVFAGSLMGLVSIYRIEKPSANEGRSFALSSLAVWSRASTGELTSVEAPISDLCVSAAAATSVYVANDRGELFVLNTETLDTKQEVTVTSSSHDLVTVNAIEEIDASCIATANQLGQLNIWDLRAPSSFGVPQKLIVPAGEPRPLLCLSQHPGQPHMLAVGGMDIGEERTTTNPTTTSYIWDLRQERHPLSEIVCHGSAVWEIRFHPQQPHFLYLATEAAGLMRIQTAASADSWTFQQISQKKLTSTCVSSNPTDYCSISTLDIANDLVICGRDNCTLQSIRDPSLSTFSC